MTRKWFKASEIGEYLGLPAKSVYSLCSKGILPHTKIRGIGLRIDLKRVDELLERHSIDSILNQLDR